MSLELYNKLNFYREIQSTERPDLYDYLELKYAEYYSNNNNHYYIYSEFLIEEKDNLDDVVISDDSDNEKGDSSDDEDDEEEEEEEDNNNNDYDKRDNIVSPKKIKKNDGTAHVQVSLDSFFSKSSNNNVTDDIELDKMTGFNNFITDSKKKNKIKQHKTLNFFQSFRGFGNTVSSDNSINTFAQKDCSSEPKDYDKLFERNDNTLDETVYTQNDFMYSVNFTFLARNSNLASNKHIILNYKGGFMPNILDRVFKKHFLQEFENETIQTHVVDFSGMYTSAMQYANVCQSSLVLNPHYPVLVKNCLYHPFDAKIFQRHVVELKFNSIVLPLLIFVVKFEFEKSVKVKELEFFKEQRKVQKKILQKFANNKLAFEYIFANAKQLYFKLMCNAAYGKFFSLHTAQFNPFCSSLITKEGRKMLMSLFVFIKYILYKKNVTSNIGRMLYGDTDSIFIDGPFCLINEIANIFNMIGKNKFIIQVELEKSLDYCIFLEKKNYLTLYNSSVYTKGVFKKSQVVPSKTFLADFILFIFVYYFEQDYATFYTKLEEILARYYSSDKNVFFMAHKLSKKISDYKNKTTVHHQIEYLQEIKNKEFVVGQVVHTSFFNYIFDYNFKRVDCALNTKLNTILAEYGGSISHQDIENGNFLKLKNKVHVVDIKKIKSELKKNNTHREMFANKFIDYTNVEMVKYLEENRSANILIRDLVDLYKDVTNEKLDNVQVDVIKIFENDLQSILNKLFICISDMIMYMNFQKIFIRVLGREFNYIKNTIKLSSKSRKNKKDENNNDILDSINSAINRICNYNEEKPTQNTITQENSLFLLGSSTKYIDNKTVLLKIKHLSKCKECTSFVICKKCLDINYIPDAVDVKLLEGKSFSVVAKSCTEAQENRNTDDVNKIRQTDSEKSKKYLFIEKMVNKSFGPKKK